VIVALLGALLAGPQQALRRPDSRIDNLRWTAVVLAAHELPGDAVLYLPSSRRIVSCPIRARSGGCATSRSPAPRPPQPRWPAPR
jgi:hypothetical protein